MLRRKHAAPPSVESAVESAAGSAVGTAFESDCGCAPTTAERLAHTRGDSLLTRRLVLAAGALGVVGLAAFASPMLPAAFAATYPSWDDVQRAKQNEASKASEIARVEKLIADLELDVQRKQAAAEQAAAEYYAALEAYEAAIERANDLQAQADAQAGVATTASEKAARVAAQIYRDGGDDAAMQLFFAGSAASADDLLARLGTMDQLLERNRDVYSAAVTARNNAQALGEQAVVARDERDRLQQEANQKMLAAEEAARAAQAALDAQAEHRVVLEAQLAALKDTTAATIEQYQVGVEVRRREEEERRRRAQEEAERIARENAANGGGGGGGGNVGGSGWARPSSGRVTSWFGDRGSICTPNGCTSSGHRGVDFASGCGSAIYAAAGGTVSFAGYTHDWGNRIVIDHGGGIRTAYGHMQGGGFAVGYGQRVSAGQYLGREGATGLADGCHLHFEVYSGGVRIDPTPFLRARGVSV